MNPLEALNQTMHAMLCDLQSIRSFTEISARAADLNNLRATTESIDDTVSLFLERLNRIEVMLAEILTRLPDPHPKG